MVLNSAVVAHVANASAHVFQYISCNPERLPSDQVLYLLFCFPFQQIQRFTLCLWTFCCCPIPDHSNFFASSSSAESSDSDNNDAHPHFH